MQILRKFYHNKHLIRKMAPLRINMMTEHTVTDNFKLLQIVHLL